MLTSENEPIYSLEDGTFFITLNGGLFCVADNLEPEKIVFTTQQVRDYIAEHPNCVKPFEKNRVRNR